MEKGCRTHARPHPSSRQTASTRFGGEDAFQRYLVSVLYLVLFLGKFDDICCYIENVNVVVFSYWQIL